MFSNLALIENKLCLNDVYALSLFFSFSLFFCSFFYINHGIKLHDTKKEDSNNGEGER